MRNAERDGTGFAIYSLVLQPRAPSRSGLASGVITVTRATSQAVTALQLAGDGA